MTVSANPDTKELQTRVLSGSFILLSGSGLVTAINFAYNIAVARFLGPTGFGDASAVYTLLILISAVTLSFQIVSAKVVAQQSSPAEQSTAYRAFQKSAWMCGISIGLLLVLFRNLISNYLNLPGSNLVVWLAIGVAFYVPLGSRRGYLQGACSFRRLAANLVLEGFFRLCGSLLLIMMGFGVPGVIAANAAAVTIAYFFAIEPMAAPAAYDQRIPDAFREALQAIVFFVGQVVINNCDIVVVKHFFPPTPAGVYAAVALVGRVIYAFSWAVVNTMFPIVAGTRSHGRRNNAVLGTSLLLVFAIGSAVAIGLRLAPAWIWTVLFGSQFAHSGKYDLSYLLALYAATTCVYSLSVVMIAYEMSYRIANTGWVQLAFSGALIASIYHFHRSLQQVVLVQLVMMVFLLAVVAVPYLRSLLAQLGAEDISPEFGRIRRIRHVSEDEVIAEFLRNDFRNPEFKDYQESLGALVASPDLTNPVENARRRALLFLRHDALWRELPRDTQWVEVQLGVEDLERIHVFPRAQWRKLARGDFSMSKVLRSLRAENCDGVDRTFLTKIADLGTWLGHVPEAGAVLLIGLNENGAFTVLDGNHRFVAAALNAPAAMGKFRFLCGMSPNMGRCCWYKTNLVTLCRYGANLLRHLMHDPETDLTRLLQSSS